MKEIKIIVTPKNGAILTIKFDKFNLFSFKYAEDKAHLKIITKSFIPIVDKCV